MLPNIVFGYLIANAGAEVVGTVKCNPHIHIYDNEVFEEINDVGERFQLLQLAYVYGFDKVVLAISDALSELIRSIIVEFTTELKEHFGRVLKQ